MRRAILGLLTIGVLSFPSAAAAEAPAPASPPPSPPSSSSPPPPPASPPAPLPPLATAPDPSAQPAPRVLPRAAPLNELGAAAVLGGTFSIVVLIVCGVSSLPSSSQSQCLEASGFSALGLFGAGIPMIIIARNQSTAWLPIPRVTYTAETRSGTLGFRGSF